MHKTLIIAAALSALAIPAPAAPAATPYVLGAIHDDFQAQLEEIGARVDETGAAARAAVGLVSQHNAAQERLILPLLGWADAAAELTVTADLPDRASLEAELSRLRDGETDVVTALVDLYATAEAAGDAGTARLAERMIWHEAVDVEVLYPAAMLVASSIRAQPLPASPAALEIAPGPLYGPQPVPMMGIGSPHGSGAGN